MDIISHVQEMLAKDTVTAYIALGIAGVCGVLMLLGALKGLSRGLTRQTVRFLTIIASIVISVLAATGITNALIGFFDGKTLQEALTELGAGEAFAEMDGLALAILNAIDPSAVQQILALPMTLIVAPIVFVLVFIFISAIMLIVHAIISGACGFTKKRNNWWTRLAGLALGAVQGLVVAAAILVPVSGLMGIVSDTVAQIERLDEQTVMASTENGGGDEDEGEFDVSEILAMYDEYLADVAESPALKLVNKFGGNLISKQLSTVKIGGQKQDARQTIPSLVGIAVDAMGLADIDITALTQDDKDTITGIIDKIMAEPLTRDIIVAGFKAAANAIGSNSELLEDVPAPFDEIVASAISVYGNSTAATVKSDLGTLCKVFFIVADSGILAETDELDPIALITAPDDENMIILVLNAFAENPNFNTIVLDAFDILADAIKNGEIEDLPEEINSFAFAINPVLDHFAEMTSLTGIVDDVKTMLAVMRDIAGTGIFEEDSEIAFEDFIFAEEGETPLIKTMLGRFVENEALDAMMMEIIAGAAEAIRNNEIEDLPEEMTEFGFVINPVLDHFADMSSISGIIADLDTIIAVMKDLDDAGMLDEDAEFDIEVFLLCEEGETPLINTILGRFAENAALDAMIMEIISGAAEAIEDGTLELPEESEEYAFLLNPVLAHFGDMESVDDVIADIDTVIEIYREIEESGITDDDFDEDELLNVLLLNEDCVIDAILDIVDENEALETLILEIITGAADEIVAGNLPLFEDSDMPEDIEDVLMEVIAVIAETDSITTLKGDIQVIQDVFALVGDIEFNEDTDYVELLFGAEEGEESVIIAALNKLAASRFDDAILGAIQAIASDPAFLEDADEATAEVIQPFLDVFTADEATLASITADIEVLQEVIILLNNSGAFEDGADALSILFVKEADEDETLILTVIGKLEATNFKDPLVNAYKSIATKDDNGNYLMLDGADALTASIVGPLLEEIARTASITDIKNDVGYISEAVTLLDSEGLLGDGSEENIDELEAIFGREGEEDSLLVQIIEIFEGTRYDDELTAALTETISDELDAGSDPTMAVITKAMFNLLHGADNLTDVKADINALGDVIVLLEVSGDGDMLALLTKDGDGNTPINKAIDEFTTDDLQSFLLEVVTGLSGGVVNYYDGEAGDDDIEISLGELAEPTLSFVIAAMEVFAQIDTVDKLDRDVVTISNIIEILDTNGLMSDEGNISVDVVTIFTDPAVNAAANETVIDLILAEFEANSDLNPVLLALTRSLSADIDLINVGAPFDMLVASVADVFGRSTAETVVYDVQTVAEVFVILVDAGVLEENADAVGILSEKDEGTGETIVDRIVATLKTNDNTKPIVTDFTKISLSLMINGTTGEGAEGGASDFEEIEETYTEAKGELDNVVADNVIVTDGGTKYSEKTEEEKQEAIESVSGAISDALDNTLKEEGSTDDTPVVDEEVAKGMAEFVLENFGDKTMEDLVEEGLYIEVKDENGDVVTDTDGNVKYEISDEAISDVILSYYNAWLAAQQNAGAGN